jgi:hypothetical protein
VVDPDPDGNGDASDAEVAGTILLDNNSHGPGVIPEPNEVTDGTGGQGVKPLPIVHDGWVQPTVGLVGTGALSKEVEKLINKLTDDQKNPEAH